MKTDIKDKGERTNENRRVALSRQMLQKALLRLLAGKSIHEISVAELCREAGVNRSTFYRLYSIPAEVMEEILRNMISEISADYLFTEGKRIENTLKTYQYIYDHREVFRAILPNCGNRVYAMLEEMYSRMFRKEYGTIESEEKSRLMIAFLLAGGLTFTSRWLESEPPVPPEEVAELLCSLTDPPSRIRRP